MTRVWGLGWDGFNHPAYPPKPEPWVRAISIRHPWAWAVIYGGKDVENRSEAAASAYRPAVGKRVLVHASSHRLSKAGKLEAAACLKGLGVEPPDFDALDYGGVSVAITSIVTEHRSPWFTGPVGLVLADPQPELFRPMRGQVGLFRVPSP